MTTATKTKRRAILAFMQNRPGVLNKISMLVRRKMYNVETITVCTTTQPGISRMTLTLYEDSDDKMALVVRQIEKVTEVISAKELDIVLTARDKDRDGGPVRNHRRYVRTREALACTGRSD